MRAHSESRLFTPGLLAWGGLVLLLALAAALIVWRSAEFAALEPRQDHAWFTQWVRAFHEAERFWPQQAEGESWRAALEADDGSALHVLLRQLYAVPFSLLNLGAFAWYGLLGLVAGVSMPAQVAISVTSLSLAIAALALFAFWIGWRSGSRREALLFAATTFVFAAGSSFLRVFSALGPHNVAILLLVLLLWASERWLALQRSAAPSRAVRRAGLAVLLLYSAAIYTYHGGTMLAPPLLALAILAESHFGLAARLRLVAGLVLWTIVLLLPLAAVAWLGEQASYMGSRDQGILAYVKLALGGGDIAAAGTWPGERARLWFVAQAQIFSPAGLVLGLAGLADLAVRRQIRAPLILALVHLACGTAIPTFTQYDRTSAYLLPVLCLGAGWAVAMPAAAILGRRRALLSGLVLAGALLLALAHAREEWPRLREPGRVAGWGYYLSQQGDWAPTQAEIEGLVPAGAVLVPWDYQVSHLYNSFRRADGAGPRLYVPVSTLRDRQADGSLQDYLARRRLGLAPEARLFILAPAGAPAATIAAALPTLISDESELQPLRRWDGKAWPLLYPGLVLYERQPAK